MKLGGELAFILGDIEYSSKPELLDKLRESRNELQDYPKEERIKLKPYLAIAVQQAFYTSEYELLRFKRLNKGEKTNDTKKEQ